MDQVRSLFNWNLAVFSYLHARVIFSRSVAWEFMCICVYVHACVFRNSFLPRTILCISDLPAIHSILITSSSQSFLPRVSPPPSPPISTFSSPPLPRLCQRRWWPGSFYAPPVLMPSWAHYQIPCTNAPHPLSAVANPPNTKTSTAIPAPLPPSPASLKGSCQLFHQAPPTPRFLQSYASLVLSCSRWIPWFLSVFAPSTCSLSLCLQFVGSAGLCAFVNACSVLSVC